MARSIDCALDRLLGAFLPPRCVLCGRLGQRPGYDLCAHCGGELPRLPGTGLQIPWWPVDRLLAQHAYTPPIDVMIQALKYHGRLALGRVLGELLADGVTALALHLDVDCLLPVPLHPHRYAERGFNQSTEIARFAARRLALPVAPGLAIRYRDTRSQVGLTPAERRGNLTGAFAVPCAVRGLRVAIVDDVITTGSTVTELARALHRAGALSVDVWCVARATLDSGARDQ